MTSLWLDRERHIETDAFDEGARYDIVVIGAGITGLISALLFARAGKRVAVFEARRVGTGTTGHTTAKLSVLQGRQLQRIARSGYPSLVRAYVQANLEGFAWLTRYAEDHHVPIDYRPAVSYAGSPLGAETVEREFRVARAAGLPVKHSAEAELPFPSYGAVSLADQAQIDPLDLVETLVGDVRWHGGVVVETARVLGVRASDPARVHTSRGEVTADRVIVATGSPILDRGLYFAKLTPKRSYGLAFEIEGETPPGMYLSVDAPTRSIRSHGPLLLIGGNGHTVGRHPSPQALVGDLTEWTERHWPGARRTHAWSAQDYETPHRVPFVGWLPRGRGRIYLATGYDKWGFTNATQCALTLAGDILGGNQPWAAALHRRVTTPMALANGIGANAAVAWWYARSWSRALSRPLGDEAPDEGEGRVGRVGLEPTGISTVDGVTCRVSAVCPHLRAVLGWNDMEHSWDCPAHGSRYEADGTRIEGPTKHDLARR